MDKDPGNLLTDSLQLTSILWDKNPGNFSTEYTKSMKSLHGIALWIYRIVMKSTFEESMRKNPGFVSTESP